MTTVGSLSGDLAPSNDVPGKSNLDSSSHLPPSPSNSVPYIIATSADDEKSEKPAPMNGTSPMRFLQGCSKLDMEPNPFEQSFAGKSASSSNNNGNAESAVETPKPILPPIEAMSGRLVPGSADQFGWDAQSLRMGPLSPSMLEGPQNPIALDEKSSVNNPVGLGSYSSGTSMFAPGAAPAPLAENGLPYGVSGPLPPVGHASEPYPPYNSLSQQPSSHHQGGPHGGPGSRQSQNYTNANHHHQPMNDRYIPPQGPQQQQQQHPDNMNGYGNLHLLSQAQATHREIWTKRESTDSNAGAPHSQHPSHSQHPHPHGQGPPMASQPPRSGAQQQQPPPSSSANGMPGMTASQQSKEVNFVFVKGVRRSRVASEDSDDSDDSKGSGKGGEGSSAGGSAKKKPNTGDEKMDEEEKRKNFLERNRQAALKCRQRKKQWLANLQAKVEYLTNDNEHLQNQTAILRDEIIHLKALLLAHKDCPVAQANGVYPDTISMPPNHSNHGMVGHIPPDRNGYPMQQHLQGGPPQGRGGPPPNQQRGPLPPPPLSHHHGPIPGGPGPRMAGPPVPSSGGPPGPPAPAGDRKSVV